MYMLNSNLPGQKFFWKKGFIEQYANQEKDQVLPGTYRLNHQQ